MNKAETLKQQRRAEVIIKVCAEKMTATEAAKELGVSRKTYHQWQNRALAGMMEALEDGRGGRPSQQEDPQIKQLRKDKEQLEIENEILQMRLQIQKIMAEDMPKEKPLLRKSKGFKRGKKNA